MVLALAQFSQPCAGGESVLVNGAVFKTVSETVRAGSGRFDSYTPPPEKQEPVGRSQLAGGLDLVRF